ncbi:MAG TPA: Spy/CpxP family protein refolding chaperone [Phenylobacterium sp.]|jgi:protein CpxP|uniref:Spy/CpxP family protein refolding chaperone n=1 Tax=Phenylobacterium sp. TaxID=1871053 RepID=UPI002BBE7FB6|nr:Spy/CpxP family protein refolding chaperone [Phenylobacterium sp.]HXA40873.1 Spy/CpxP family protein refolding chaperone [Phenylobacterium sp.]
MTPPLKACLAGAAFALTAAASAAAFAQPPAPPAPDAGDHHQMREERHVVIRHDGGGDEHMVAMMRHGHEDQAEHLRTMLQLKPSQEAALTAYLAAVKPEHHHEAIVEMSDHHDGAKTTTQRLAEMDTHLTEQTAQAHARIEATRKFYNQLEPSQKKVFDEMPMLMMGPMGPMMHGGMRVMVNMDGHGDMRFMDHMPPVPPTPPVPPAPPRLDD